MSGYLLMSAEKITLVGALLFSGIISGLFVAWAVSVIPGTKLVDDRSYVTTMQQINRAIINPAFLLSFLLPPFVLVASAVVFGRAGMQRRSWLLAASAATYLAGVLGVTAARNIPLNNQLESFDLEQATAAAIARQRADYEDPWNRWNAVRTGAAVASFAFVVVAAVLDETTE